MKYFKLFKFPPKRFLRKLIVYKNTGIYDLLNEKGLIQNGQTIYNPTIERIYSDLKKGLSYVSKLREPIRRLEKIMSHIGMKAPSNFKIIREYLDDQLYTLFEFILKGNKNESEMFLNDLFEELNTFKERLNQQFIKYDFEVNNKIKQITNIEPDKYIKILLNQEL